MKKSLVRKLVKKEEKKLARKVVKKSAKLIGKLSLFALLTFVVTFTIFMFNLENKLIYYVVYPFLQKHYNKQNRNRMV